MTQRFRLLDFLPPDLRLPDFLPLDFFPPDFLLEDFPPPARVGSFFRFALAIRSSSFSLMELAMLFDAPRNEVLDFSPRFAANAAPAAICCFFDFAGITTVRFPPLMRLGCN